MIEGREEARIRAVHERWLWAVGYGLIAAVIVWLMAPWAPTLADWSKALHLGSWASYGLMALLGVVLARASFGRSGAFWGIRHFPSYPPLWVSVAVGAVAVVGLWLGIPASWAAASGVIAPTSIVDALQRVAVAALTATVAGGVAFWVARTKKVPIAASPSGEAQPDSEFARLCRWLQTGEAATDDAEDWFEYGPTADRIANRLCQTQGGSRPRQFPERVLPALACFVTEEAPRTVKGPEISPLSYVPDEDAAARLFGDYTTVRDLFGGAAIAGAEGDLQYQAMRRAALQPRSEA